jgi:endonuclease/exonuclease/phosphatase family metal-dependent hydrolase
MQLKILSFNIHKGFSPLGRRFTLHDIKEYLEDYHADIVFLQEVVGENQDHAEKITDWPEQSQFEFLADRLWPHHAYAKNAVYEKRHHGNVILSKYPIIETLQVDVSKNSWEQRGVLYAKIQLPNEKELNTFCVHLNLLNKDRQKQYKDLQSIIRHYGVDHPIILAGDFNDWNKEASTGLEGLGIHDAHKTLHGDYARTFPALFPMVKLDRCYTNLKVVHAQAIHNLKSTILSDHSPLSVVVECE